jgi:tetratricopeptide (TPR) repeat protein
MDELKIRDLLNEALKLHRSNDLINASKLYNQIIEIDRDNFDAIHLLGVIEYQNNNYLIASDFIRKAISINPNYADAHNNLGNTYRKANNLKEALLCYENAIKLNQQHADAYSNRGNVLKELTQIDEALKSYNKALSIRPNFIEVHFNCGNLFHDLANFSEAIKFFSKAITLNPKYTQAYNNRGSSFHAIGQYIDAIKDYDTAISINENYFEAYNNRGFSFHELGEYDKAIENYKIAVLLNPIFPEAFFNIANTYSSLKNNDLSILNYNKAINLRPNYANAYNNRSVLMKNMGFDFSAISDADIARMQYLNAYSRNELDQKGIKNLGLTNRRVGNFLEAELNLKKALSQNSNDLIVKESLGTLQLCMGNFKEGWLNYQGRSKSPQNTLIPNIRKIKKNSKVLLLREQGFGDELFFLRFANTLKSAGINLSYKGSPRIKPLIADDNLFEKWIEPEIETNNAYYDYQIAIGNLPLVLEIDSINKIPEPLKLKTNINIINKVKCTIDKLQDKKLIGLTWRSGTEFSEKFLFKQAPLEQLGKLLKDKTGSIIILQRYPKPGELDMLSNFAGRKVFDFSKYNEDFESMLALLSLLDEYVGVSNTNMHLLAGLSKPAKVLIPFPPEFRWMDKGISPWFTEFSLYRQEKTGDWTNAFNQLSNDLQ